MNHYYFVNYTIKVFEWEVNTDLNPAYVELTDEQRDFYLDHPNASYWEVEKCELDPQPEPIIPTLEEEQEGAKKYLSDLSLTVLGKYVKEYQLANAQSSLYELSQDPSAVTIYDESHSKEIISTYNKIGRELRNIYKSAESDINSCTEIAEVAVFRAYYEDIYNNYEYVPNNNEE